MKWSDAEDIGIALTEKFPDLDPLTVRFTDLRNHVLELDDFDDDPKGVERAEARGDSDGVVRGMEGRALSLGGVFRPGMRGYFVPFGAGVALIVSAFLPWVVVSGVSRAGAPDAPGLWVAGLGVLSAVLAALSLITRKNSRHPLLVLGLMALGIITLTWRIVPRLAGEEALTMSQALAIVEDAPIADMPTVPTRARRQRPVRRRRRRDDAGGLRPDDCRPAREAVRRARSGRRRLSG